MLAFYNRSDFPTARALVLEVEGEVVGVAGVTRVGEKMVAFSDVREDMKGRRATLTRAALQAIRFVKEHGAEAAFGNEKSSPDLLRRAGFRYVRATPMGDYYEVVE